MDRAAVKVSNFDRVGAVCEIDHRHTALIPGLDEDIPTRHRNHAAIVGDTVLFTRLRRRDLVVAPELQLAVDDVINRVGTPVLRIGCPATWRRTAAPLIREQHFCAIVVEGG